MLLKAMMIGARSTVSTAILLTCLSYIFAVALRFFTVDSVMEEKYFSSVPIGMKILFLWTAMPDVIEYVDELGEHSIVVGLLVVVFVMIAGMALLNMLIGVLCEVIDTVSTAEKEYIKVIWVKEELVKVLRGFGMTIDSDTTFKKDDFKGLLVRADVVNVLHSADVDPVGLADTIDYIFGHEFGEAHVEGLTFEQVVDVILRLRGCNYATVKDVIDMRKVIFHQLSRIEHMLTHQDAMLGRMCLVPHALSSTVPAHQDITIQLEKPKLVQQTKQMLL